MAHATRNPSAQVPVSVPEAAANDHREAPRLPRVYVPRTRLWEQLDRTTAGPLTLLVAPGGAGKTLGVSGWVRVRTAPDDEHPVWVQGNETLSAVDLMRLIDETSLLATDDAPSGLVIVDDAQALPSATLRALDERLSLAPETMRVLLLSRWDLPLTRLVPELLGNFTILRGETLRMTDAESAALIKEHARTNDLEVIRLVTERAQGWCAAVVLAARTIAAARNPLAAARELAGPGAPVADRVASEVFATLGQRQRHLLLCVASEGVVSVSTAAHLSHDAEAGDVLAELETTGLLVTRVPAQPFATRDEETDDTDSEIDYRIHPLLVEVIRRRLTAGGVDVSRARGTVARAVSLDIARGRIRDSLRRLLSVHAVDEAADVLARHGVRLILAQPSRPDVVEFARAHPDVIEARPDVWFPLALERWVANDTTAARHWADRIVEREADESDSTRWADADPTRLACVRMWRALLGLEPFYAAIGQAKRMVLTQREEAGAADSVDSALPVLLHELGVAQNWLGDLAEAETNLTLAVAQSRTRGMNAFALSALTHLALTEYMAGREHACVGLALEALELLEVPRKPPPLRFAPSRAELALALGRIVDVPYQLREPVTPPRHAAIHHADLTAQFWSRIRDARLQLTAGSAAGAERVLVTPSDYAELVEVNLPGHLRSAMLVERAFVATLSGDRESLKSLEAQLTEIQAGGEAALVRGLRADLDGDRRRAAAAFESAAADAVYSQPPTRSVALVCEAQLRDALGETTEALDLLRTAVTETEVRRNAAPFMGWTHQGTPMRLLLDKLGTGAPTGWTAELITMLDDVPDLMSTFRASTASPRERETAGKVTVRPILSPREREVLGELARGSTYADIAATLFVSENTVKTHVSSLYGKLAVTRRSEALAVGRSLGLL